MYVSGQEHRYVLPAETNYRNASFFRNPFFNYFNLCYFLRPQCLSPFPHCCSLNVYLLKQSCQRLGRRMFQPGSNFVNFSSVGTALFQCSFYLIKTQFNTLSLPICRSLMKPKLEYQDTYDKLSLPRLIDFRFRITVVQKKICFSSVSFYIVLVL